MDSFWDFFWFIISFFLLMAYLMVLFQIVVDLFRDHTVSGGMKAVWVLGLIFLPILTALIYLISRGGGMAERAMAAQQGAQANADAYIRSGGVGRWLAGGRDRPGQGVCWTPAPSAPRSSRSSRRRPCPDALTLEPGSAIGGRVLYESADVGVRLVRGDRAAALGDGVADDPALVAHQRPAAADQHQRRLAALAQVAGQPPPEGDGAVLPDAVRRGEQPGVRAAGDDVLGEEALRDEQPVPPRSSVWEPLRPSWAMS